MSPCPYHEPPDQICRIFEEVAVPITEVQNDQTLNVVHSRPALLCHCLGTRKDKKALLCLLRGYKPIRIRHFQAGETDETPKLYSQK